ncbi:MAG: Mpo1-like protein [Noviherbaspirillum sp.]
MNIQELLQRQWNGYPRYHGSRTNLLLHIVVVPLFLVGNVSLLFALVQGAWLLAVVSLVAMIVSVALQGRGHRTEQVPPEPFTSPVNAVSRIFLEQWVTFPRFVFSGGWSHALRQRPARLGAQADDSAA